MLSDVLTFLAVGFAAQLVDGAIGMAYGLTSTTILLSLGVPPAVASASVHTAEVFTTGASGISHWRFGNVDGKLFRRLAVPGAIGGAAGAYLLTELPGDKVQPFVSAYLAVMGGVVLWGMPPETSGVTSDHTPLWLRQELRRMPKGLG